MNPTPSPAPTNGVAILMAEIERIAQELRAANKRPLPATEDQVKALVKLAERERPLTVDVNSQAVADRLTALLVNQVAEQARTFQQAGNKLLTALDERQRVITNVLGTGIGAIEASELNLANTAKLLPKSVPLDWRGNWKFMLGVALGPVLLVLVAFGLAGMYSRVPKAELERVQGEKVQAQSQLTLFRQGRAQLAQDAPVTAHKYFPLVGDPPPSAAAKPASPTKKKARH